MALLIFVDGLGIGPADPAANPLAAIGSRIFLSNDIPCGGMRAETDACLGVAGLPQSATGQTTLLTGINAPALLGRHLSGYPNQQLKDLLARESIFAQLAARGKRGAFANCYRPAFFSDPPWHVSVTTWSCLSAGIRLNTLEDLQAGRALYHDFTREYLRAHGISAELLQPEEAGVQLAEISRAQDFTLYEYFLTDLVAHAQDWQRALALAAGLERFVTSVLEHSDLERQTVVLSSDHGNFEDFTTRSHTRNPVHTICWGRGKEKLARAIRSLQDVTPALVDLLCNNP